MKEQGSVLQTKQHNKFIKTSLNEMEISNLSNREIKIIDIKMLITKVKREVHKQNMISTETENIKSTKQKS